MILDNLNLKDYKIPINIPNTTRHRYMEVINKDYGKYLEAIALSGGFCMYKQFGKLLNAFNYYKDLSDGTIEVYTTSILKDIEDLGFIGSDYLNRNKYIYLRHPAFALVEGDYKTSKRLVLKNELKINRFITNIIKMEYLINYNNYFSSGTLDKQLLWVTEKVLDFIKKSGNLYKYDTTTIRRIIELGNYKDIKYIIDNTRENTTKLGVVRFIWSELGREFWKLGLQGQTIEETPFYFKLNMLNDGKITLHYAPNIILFDSSRDLQYYNTQSNKYFNMFFNMKSNATQRLKSEYINKNSFGYEHFNRVGYTVKVIGSIDAKLQDKIDILNRTYYRADDTNEHSPLISPCTYVEVDIDDYFLYARNPSRNNNSFANANRRIEHLIKSEKEREGI